MEPALCSAETLSAWSSRRHVRGVLGTFPGKKRPARRPALISHVRISGEGDGLVTQETRRGVLGDRGGGRGAALRRLAWSDVLAVRELGRRQHVHGQGGPEYVLPDSLACPQRSPRSCSRPIPGKLA